MPQPKRTILFVDDDVNFLEMLQRLMRHFSGETWEILLASEASQALAILKERHSVDLLVIDLHMPVVDGAQFLGLLRRQYPSLIKVVLTGDTNGAQRSTCLSQGAELFLEKPRAENDWQGLYAALNELARLQPEEGFRGVLRRVSLQDVLQMECLARNSSKLEISTAETRGTIFIKQGQIIHAEDGVRTGEAAFNYLLSLQGGEFNLKPFIEPPTSSIRGSWEFLLMEAARQRDEAAGARAVEIEAGPPAEIVPSAEALSHESAIPNFRPQIDEVLLCSRQGDVLYQRQCANVESRLELMNLLAENARQVGDALALGGFDRLEMESPVNRVVAQVRPNCLLLVRTSQAPTEPIISAQA